MIIKNELIIGAKEELGEKAAFIIAEDLNLKQFDSSKLTAICPFHDESTPSFKWNKSNNAFHCFGGSCGINYGIIDHFLSYYHYSYLESVKKLFDLIEKPFEFEDFNLKPKKNYRYPVYVSSENRQKVESYLSKRKISKEALDYCDIQEDNNGNIVFHYFDLNDKLCMVKYRPARKVKINENKMWFQKDTSTMPLLFNMNRIDTTQPLVITEGCIDTLSIIESGYRNAVSVPFGSNSESWIEHNFEWLEQFEKIIIWADNDDAGFKMRQNACARLGSWKTLYVSLDECTEHPVNDANEVLFYYGKEKVLELIENANIIPLEDFEDIDNIDIFDLKKEQGIYTTLEQVDRVINKLYFGNVVIWTGKRGNGKSVAANQIAICEPLNQGYSVAAFSLELPNNMLKSWIDRNIAGRESIHMDGKIPYFNAGVLSQIKEWRQGRCFLYTNETNRNYKYIIQRIEEVVRRKGVKSVLIDNFMMIDLAVKNSDKYDKQVEFMSDLVTLAKKLYCVIHLVAHPRKTNESNLSNDDVSGSGHITDLAQYVFSVKRYTDREKDNFLNEGLEEYDMSLSILKNRITGEQDKTFNLFFDYPSYRIYDTSESLWKRYKWNKSNESIREDNPKVSNNNLLFLER